MNTQQTVEQNPAKFKTTLYLTESNRKQLEQFTRGSRTKLINQAIAEKLAELQKEDNKLKILASLKNRKTTPSNGTPTEEALQEIRASELQNLVGNK